MAHESGQLQDGVWIGQNSAKISIGMKLGLMSHNRFLRSTFKRTDYFYLFIYFFFAEVPSWLFWMWACVCSHYKYTCTSVHSMRLPCWDRIVSAGCQAPPSCWLLIGWSRARNRSGSCSSAPAPWLTSFTHTTWGTHRRQHVIIWTYNNNNIWY